jgi:hypothetical protein
MRWLSCALVFALLAAAPALARADQYQPHKKPPHVTALSVSVAPHIAVTSLSFQVGQTVHVTVLDQSGNAINPAMITWSPLGSPSIATGSADATGFNFLGTAAGSVTATVTYTAPAGVTPATVTGTLPVTVTAAPVTSLKFTSP